MSADSDSESGDLSFEASTKKSCMSSMPGQFGTTPGHAVSQPPAPRASGLTLAQRLAPMGLLLNPR